VSAPRTFLLVTGVVLLSRLPFLGAGYGWDSDAWRVAALAQWIVAHGQYAASRFPGNPVHELLCALLVRGGPWALNGISAVASAIGAGCFAVLLRRLGVRYAALGALALASTPAFYVASVSTMDYALTLGLRPPSPARIREATRQARADDFVQRLPKGYATPCAEAPRSGGESQRLGLARAFAHDGRLLILDDALSSLDTVTEAQIAESLLTHGSDTTRLLIAHRAATAARADAVAWLDGGRVRAVGTHAQLWRTAGYRAVFGDGGQA